MRRVTVVVSGAPVTQGSMKAFMVKGRPRVTHNNGSKLDGWRGLIRDAICRQVGENPEMFTGPVCISKLEFRLPRYSTTPKTKRTYPIGKMSGDIDKLERAVLDAITDILIIDDSQVVRVRDKSKDWAEIGCQPGVTFVIEEVVE